VWCIESVDGGNLGPLVFLAYLVAFIFHCLCGVLSRLMEEKLKKDNSSSLSQLLKRLKSAAETKGLSLEQRTARMKEREKKVVAKCFHGAGIVVPIDKNGVGYRPLPETPGLLVILSPLPMGIFHCHKKSSIAVLCLIIWQFVGPVRFNHSECCGFAF